MVLKNVFLALTLVTIVVCNPTKDVEIVESTIREVRAAPPDDLLLAATNYGHDYGADDEDSIGYLKRSEEGGSDGYKHFDSYHKKDGDKYGYEKHTAFGKADNAEYDAGSKDDDKETKSDYKVAEEANEGDDTESYGDTEKYSEGDYGHYTDGDNEHITEGEGEHFGYEGDDGESAKYSAAEGEAEEAEGEEDY